MKKASKFLLNFSGVIGIVSTLMLLVTMHLLITLTIVDFVLLINTGFTQNLSVLYMILLYVFGRMSFFGLILIVIMAVASIIPFIALINKKYLKIANMVTGLSGLLPLLVFGPLALLLILAFMAIPFSVYIYGHIIYNAFEIIFMKISFSFLFGYFALFTVGGVLLGVGFTILTILGSIFGMFNAKKKEPEEIKEKEEIL